MTWFSLIYFVAFLAIVFIWALVHSQNSTDSLNRAYILLVAYCGAFVFLEFIVQLPGMAGLESVTIKATEIVWIPLGYIYLHFVYRLLGRKPDHPYWIFAVVTALVVIYSQWPTHYGAIVSKKSWGIEAIPRPAEFAVYTTAPALAVLFGMGLIVKAIRSESDRGLSVGALTLILLGTLLAFVSLFIQNVALPVWAPHSGIPRFGSPTLAVFALIVYGALHKQHLFWWNSEYVAANLFNSVDEGIALIDRHGAVRQINDAMRQILGLEKQHIGRRLASSLIPGFKINDAVLEQEVEIGLKESTRTYQMSKASYTRRGVPMGHLLFLNDISKEKKNEALLKMSQKKMESEIARRTDEFFQMQKMVAIGTLAPGIVHDFNNLLASIIGFASAAKDDLPEGHPVRDDLDEVLGAAFRAREIVGQIPTSAEDQSYKETPVKVSRVIDEVLGQLSVSLANNITVKKDIRTQSSFIVAKSTHFHQIVMNLCTNALGAMRRTGGTLTVVLSEAMLEEKFTELHPPLKAGMHIALKIRDTGKGMDEQTLAMVFEPFFTTKKTGEGTGLGLSLVHKLVTGMGGYIDVQSEEGQGSTFTVYLPSIVREPWQSLAPTTVVRGGKESIMVVDDNEQVGRAAKRMLSSLGYNITVVADPSVALNMYRDNPASFDILITDQTMPQMTGLRLCEKLLSFDPTLPILLVTGATKSGELKERAVGLGIRDFLAKPVLKDSLADAVRKALDQ